MPGEEFDVCIDRPLPRELEGIGRATAAKEQALARPSPFELALASTKAWRPNRTLRVRFLDGAPSVHDKVKVVAREWTRDTHIAFDFGQHPDAEIRISFTGPGNWSALGTDALVAEYYAKHEPTMNLGSLGLHSSETDYARVVLHEFGHALGCIHEHQSPPSGIRWNKAVVYRDLAGPPNFWDKQSVDFNLFRMYEKNLTQFTQFDPTSIMVYPIPKEWTLDGLSIGWNTSLSKTDRRFIASRYPANSDINA